MTESGAMIVGTGESMLKAGSGDGAAEKEGKQGGPDGTMDSRRQNTLLKTGALQDAIFNSANFSSIATDAKGVIQIFNVGAERMLGYAAAEVINKLFLCTALNATESLRSTREDQK